MLAAPRIAAEPGIVTFVAYNGDSDGLELKVLASTYRSAGFVPYL